MKRRLCSVISMLLIISAISTANSNVYAASKPSKVAASSIKTSSTGPYSLSLKWSKASNAKKYKVAYRYNSKQSWSYLTTSSTSIKLDNLYPNKTYSIRIQSINGSKTSDWTTTKSFKTTSSPYNKNYSSSVKTKHVIGVVEGGWVTVEVNTHISDYYYYDGNYKKFGYRCYGATFSSINSKTLLNRLTCYVWPAKHYTAYVENGKTKYKSNKCSALNCKHDHIYAKETFSKHEYDSTTVVSHKKNSSGYITIGYDIAGGIGTGYAAKKDVKFSNIAK